MQCLQVHPFDAYREFAALSLPEEQVPPQAREEALHSARELERVMQTLTNLWEQAYATMPEVGCPQCWNAV
jgi:hypothetical protein